MRNTEYGMGSAPWLNACALLGTLLWAVHPLRVEPVAWVTGLPYHLALCFALVATLLYLRSHAPEAEMSARRRDYWLSVAAFALAVLSYPIVLDYVAALVALDFYPLRRFKRGDSASLVDAAARKVWFEKVPFLLLSVVLVAGTVYGRFFVTGDWSKPTNLGEFTMVERAMQGSNCGPTTSGNPSCRWTSARSTPRCSATAPSPPRSSPAPSPCWP